MDEEELSRPDGLNALDWVIVCGSAVFVGLLFLNSITIGLAFLVQSIPMFSQWGIETVKRTSDLSNKIQGQWFSLVLLLLPLFYAPIYAGLLRTKVLKFLGLYWEGYSDFGKGKPKGTIRKKSKTGVS
ncbi:MAG: hypothetical protein ACREJQ_03665 [bacterium]